MIIHAISDRCIVIVDFEVANSSRQLHFVGKSIPRRDDTLGEKVLPEIEVRGPLRKPEHILN